FFGICFATLGAIGLSVKHIATRYISRRNAAENSRQLTGVADAVGDVAGAFAGDVHVFGVLANLIKKGKEALGFGEEAAVHVGFELEKGVIDAQAVIAHAAGDQVEVLLLAGQAFEDLKKLRGGGVQSVIEFDFVSFGALLPAEGFFAEVGDFAVNVQIQSLEMMEIGGEGEHAGAQGGADFKSRCAGIFVELANFVGCGVGIVADGDFNEFRSAAGKDAAESELCGSGIGRSGGQEEENQQNGSERKEGGASHSHRMVEMREG